MKLFRTPIFVYFATAVAAAAFAKWQCWPSLAASEMQTAIATFAQIGTTMLGFMLAAMAILASINHTHLVSMMRKSGHYVDLLKTLFGGSAAFLVATLLSVVVLFGFKPGVDYLAVLVGVHFAALVALMDCARKFWMVLKNLQP